MTLFGKIFRVTQICQSLHYYLVEYCRVAYHSKALFMLYQKIITESVFEQQDGIYGQFRRKNAFFCAFSKSCEHHKCQKEWCDGFDIALQDATFSGDVPFG